VAGWDEDREVVKAIAVDAPEERADDLSDRRDRHNGECLESRCGFVDPQKRGQHPAREDAEEDLAREVHVAIEEEAADGPRRDRGNGDEGDAAGPLPAARMRAAQAFLSVVETKVTSMFTQPLPWPASLRVG